MIEKIYQYPISFLIYFSALLVSSIGLFFLSMPSAFERLYNVLKPLITPFSMITLIALVLGLSVAAILLAWASHAQKKIEGSNTSRIEGKHLFEYNDFYPVNISPATNEPSLKPSVFVKAMNHFLNNENDKLAVMDLIYLRETSRKPIGDVLPKKEKETYSNLVKKYDLEDFITNLSKESDAFFKNTIRIVNDIGDTLTGVYFEIILHDVRNPLRSIIAAKNSAEVSCRRIHDPSARFIIQYLQNQSHLTNSMESGSKVSYATQSIQNKKIKSTTTPIYHDSYGLIGVLCFNIDVEAIKKLKPSARKEFIEKYIETVNETPAFEKQEALVD